MQIYYPPQYFREVWHYKDVDIELIRRVIDGFNWKKAFSNKNVNEKVDTFNQTILNILSNFIPHETITCDDRDPPWFNKNIKSLKILKFIRPSSNSFYNCHNPIGIKYITRIRLGLSHLREHKFKHSFQDSMV